MRIVLRVLAAVFAFAIGVGTVAGLESMISRHEVGEIPLVHDNIYSNDLERFAAEKTLSIKLDFNVRGIRLGSTENDVIKTFGKPLSIEPWDVREYDLQTYHYKDLDIRISKDEGESTVDEIDILSTKYAFQGVNIGTSVDDAIQRLGRNYRDDSETEFEYDSFVDDGYVNFRHDGDKITGITTGFHGC